MADGPLLEIDCRTFVLFAIVATLLNVTGRTDHYLLPFLVQARAAWPCGRVVDNSASRPEIGGEVP
jgi:hypothetical protein